ncbi:MAG: ABC transporter ATP-binding protein [Janthinobacterium lividum]
MPYAIEAHDLHKTYGVGSKATRAVNGLSLRVPEGSIYGLLGRNSAGKSTTIRMAMGLTHSSSGSIRVLGLDPARDPERIQVLQQTGYVPEDKRHLGFTTRKLLDFNRAFYPATWCDALARKVASRLELPLDTGFLRLSLGNKTKSSLVSAIAQRSRLLILDEPTTGLDPVALDALLRILVEDCTKDGRTIFLSSHQLAEIEQIADYIGIMDRGRLLLEGPLDDIHSRFRRITVTGAGLPVSSPEILSTKRAPHGTQYIVQSAPESFTHQLTANGATVVDTVPLSLNEIFLELCRTAEDMQEREEGTAA